MFAITSTEQPVRPEQALQLAACPAPTCGGDDGGDDGDGVSTNGDDDGDACPSCQAPLRAPALTRLAQVRQPEQVPASEPARALLQCTLLRRLQPEPL